MLSAVYAEWELLRDQDCHTDDTLRRLDELATLYACACCSCLIVDMP